MGLIHMNGRVYDPLLARFGTPDPMTESPFSTQGWNRYTYVGNSPVNFTDPSGYCFLGCFWKPLFKAIGRLFQKVPILGTILQVAAGVICAPAGLSAVCASAASAFVTGVTSGDLGLAIKAGITAFITAQAFDFVGTATTGHQVPKFLSPAHVANMAGHALVGCASSVAQGGKCGPGALSAAAGSFAGPILKGLNFQRNLVAHSVVGGLASVAGGGKFANGAITAAFGYLFNEGGGEGGDGRPLPPDDNYRIKIPVSETLVIFGLAIYTIHEAIVGLLSPPLPQDHHLFPQQFESWFYQRKINVDDYTVTIDRTMHLRGIHGTGLGDLPGRWNSEWARFINSNPQATRSEVFQQAGSMMDRYRLNNYPIHPYRK